MRISSALLCGYAEIREGLLFIMSGGIARLNALGLPCPFIVFLAAMMEIQPDEFDIVHEVRVSVVNAGDAREVGSATGAIKPPVPLGIHPGEPMVTPLVVPLSPIILHSLGPHDVRISVDGEPAGHLTCYVDVIGQT